MKTRPLILLPLIAALAGCATEATRTRPDTGLPPAYAGAAAASTTSTVPLAADWWTLWRDPALDALVSRVLAGNLDLRLAAARVDETAAVLGLTRAAQWPGVDLNAGVTRSRASQLNNQPITVPETTSHSLLLSTRFEIDLWGRLRHADAAAQSQLLASEHARDAVRVALAAATVQAWFGLRALDAQQALLAAQLRSRSDSLALVQRRVDAGLASALEAAQAQAALAALQVQVPELGRQRAVLGNQLAQLAGEPGAVLPLPLIPALTPALMPALTPALMPAPWPAALPPPLTPPAGLPADLLQRRPDVRQAEAALAASQYQVEVARAAMWPTLSLTGSFGGQSADLIDLLKAGARSWSIGPSLLLPLFDGGRNRARTAQARAQAEQSAIAYQKTVQQAFREVADALANASAVQAQAEPLARQRAAAAEGLRIAQRRHEAGYSGYLEVLDAQRVLFDAELQDLRLAQARLDASVVLVKALGGGWTGR